MCKLLCTRVCVLEFSPLNATLSSSSTTSLPHSAFPGPKSVRAATTVSPLPATTYGEMLIEGTVSPQ